MRFVLQARSALAGCVLAAATLLPASSPAAASSRPVTLGEVAAPEAPAAIRAELERALVEELASLDFGRARYAQGYILSASLQKLETAKLDRSVSSTCVVSLALRNRGHVLVALLKGRATAEDARENGAQARAAALRGAVRSAVSRLPSTLRANERKS